MGVGSLIYGDQSNKNPRKAGHIIINDVSWLYLSILLELYV